MLFDKLCGIVEKNQDRLGMLVEPLREAKLFVFDRPAHEVATPEALDGVDWDLFCLPFRVTAIEDSGSVVLIADTHDDVIGLNQPRIFVELMSAVGGVSGDRHKGFSDDQETRRLVDMVNDAAADDPFHSISISMIYSVDYSQKGRYQVEAELLAGGVFTGKTNELVLVNAKDMPGDMAEASLFSVSRNAKAALEEIAIALGPSHFVVETTSAKPLKLGPKIPRSHQRPIYTALKPTEIRKRLGIERPESQGGTKTPHERRRHPRRLSAEGGHYKQDRVIIVKATWVGTSEAQVGNKRYKVILD